MNHFLKYASFIKLEHTLFSLPLVLSGAMIANGSWPSLQVLILMLLAAIGARTFALCMNRLIDRRIDRENPRTKDWPLPSGSMKVVEAWGVAVASLFIYLIAATLLSDFCLRLSWIPLAAFVAYPYLKRVTKWSHLWLGVVWSMVPLGGFFAVNPSFKGIGPVLFLSVFSIFWLAGFDIIYSTLDEDFDKGSGLHSLPSALGSERALKVSGLFHLLAFAVLVLLYGVWLAGPITVIFLMIIGLLLYLEHQFIYYVDLAFFKLNVAVGCAVLFFIVAGIKGV
ncbi:MAG: putative 4-hydroxybenzoate polyprenyltransferase [Elusimicrobia bacterium]|nr:putative 4-hydroxybenzoate polyprenyltransferase [Candidatus Obscuribacterium magneticum]